MISQGNDIQISFLLCIIEHLLNCANPIAVGAVHMKVCSSKFAGMARLLLCHQPTLLQHSGPIWDSHGVCLEGLTVLDFIRIHAHPSRLGKPCLMCRKCVAEQSINPHFLVLFSSWTVLLISRTIALTLLFDLRSPPSPTLHAQLTMQMLSFNLN